MSGISVHLDFRDLDLDILYISEDLEKALGKEAKRNKIKINVSFHNNLIIKNKMYNKYESKR